jgi:hypothetical protein
MTSIWGDPESLSLIITETLLPSGILFGSKKPDSSTPSQVNLSGISTLPCLIAQNGIGSPVPKSQESKVSGWHMTSLRLSYQ